MLSALLVDEPLVGHALERLMPSLGVALDVCSDVPLFWGKARAGAHRVLILAEELGVYHGSELCAQLRRVGDTRPLILTSPWSLDGDRLAAACGADAFVAKEPGLIAQTAHKIAGAERVSRPAIAKCKAVYVHVDDGDVLTISDDSIELARVTVRMSAQQRRALQYVFDRAPELVTCSELKTHLFSTNAVSKSATSNVPRRVLDKIGDKWIERVAGGWRGRVRARRLR